MQFQITDIEFDFDLDGDGDPIPSRERISEEYAQVVIADHIGIIVEADDEDDMIEEITSNTGWCVRSINYRIILK